MTAGPRTPKGSHSAQPGDPGYGPGRKRGKGFYRSEVEREAFRQGMTVEEYGIYKGSVGSAVKPVNSAGGLLAISLVITAIYAFCLVLFAVHWVQAGPGEALKNTIPLLLVTVFVPWSWRYYSVERRAEKLRKARGITLVRPDE